MSWEYAPWEYAPCFNAHLAVKPMYQRRKLINKKKEIKSIKQISIINNKNKSVAGNSAAKVAEPIPVKKQNFTTIAIVGDSHGREMTQLINRGNICAVKVSWHYEAQCKIPASKAVYTCFQFNGR